MYISVLVSLFLGVFFSGVLLDKFEIILIKVLIPIINFIKKNNNDPYKLKIVYYVDGERPFTQYKVAENQSDENQSDKDDESQENQSEKEEDRFKEEDQTEREEQNEREDQNERVEQTEKEEELENNDINNLLNKINTINNKSNVVYLDENLD